MTPELRSKMSSAATELGRLLKYEGAGTVEFIVDARTGGFYFLEVNTRVQVFAMYSFLNQVEHPITEETTLVDIVALQIYVASGGLLKHLTYLSNLKQYVPPFTPSLMSGPCYRTPSLRRGPLQQFSALYRNNPPFLNYPRNLIYPDSARQI